MKVEVKFEVPDNAMRSKLVSKNFDETLKEQIEADVKKDIKKVVDFTNIKDGLLSVEVHHA